MKLRFAEPGDTRALLDIYARYVVPTGLLPKREIDRVLNQFP